MNPTPALAGFALLLAALGGAPGARCDELVQVAPHRAAAGLAGSEGTPPLLGYLARPDGPGRLPAVVLLHGCSGFTPHDTEAAWTLKSWGYVGLALDSLGNANMCAESGGAGAEARDAYAALRYLGAQGFVAADRVAVMGYWAGPPPSSPSRGAPSKKLSPKGGPRAPGRPASAPWSGITRRARSAPAC